jgi:aminoglycoside 6'-N-acetyltransferase
MPHVKTWWDSDIHWTSKLIWRKYKSYVYGWRFDGDILRYIDASIISVDDHPVGYIQSYNAYDFSRNSPLKDLPKSLASFDILIGEKDYLRKGIGSTVILTLLESFKQTRYTHVFVDPDLRNTTAIKAYEKVGFIKVKENPETGDIWMLRKIF